MKTLLVFPPSTDPAHPPLGIAALAAYLRHHGEKVDLLDLNVLSYYWLLSPESLGRCADRLDRRIAEMEEMAELPPDQAREYRRAVPSHLSVNHLQERIPEVLAAFRRPETYRDMHTYQRTVTVLRRAMELVSAAYHPMEWTPRTMLMKYLPTRTSEILAAIEDHEHNPFLAFFDAHMNKIGALDPSIIGISVNYYSQLITGITLAALIKNRWPDRPVLLGGGLIGFFCSNWKVLEPLSTYVDAFVTFEGERPLLGLIEALKNGESPENVPGVLSFKDGRESYVPAGEPIPVPELPPPDYHGLPLDQYLSPETVLPMQTSRGCYWGRCAFCSHSHLYRGRFGKKPGEAVALEMATLSRRFGARKFYFTDECIPPSTGLSLADKLSESGNGLSWFGETRFEPAFDPLTIKRLAGGGACMLMFGLESGCQRVLDSMDKGTDLHHASSILKACHAEGIAAFVLLFIGFPGESRNEAEKTLQFLLEHRPLLRHIAATRFILEHQSPVYLRSDDFGVTPRPNDPEDDLKTFSDYELTAGLGQEEAREFVCELREHPMLSQLADQNVVSRMHLVFLPNQSEEPDEHREPRWPEAVRPERIRLRRKPDLVGVTLPFNFDEIDSQLDQEQPTSVKSRSTAYLFSPREERMVEVGDDGLRLLAPCDGRYRVGEILETVGPENRKTVLDFYRDLVAAGMLSWEEKP